MAPKPSKSSGRPKRVAAFAVLVGATVSVLLAFMLVDRERLTPAAVALELLLTSVISMSMGAFFVFLLLRWASNVVRIDQPRPQVESKPSPKRVGLYEFRLVEPMTHVPFHIRIDGTRMYVDGQTYRTALDLEEIKWMELADYRLTIVTESTRVRIPYDDRLLSTLRLVSGQAIMEASQQPREPDALLERTIALLKRGSRSDEEWRQELTAAQGAHYRVASLDVSTLWRVLEATDAPEEAQLGAAVALAQSAQNDPSTRKRLARIAETTDSERIRNELSEVVEADSYTDTPKPLKRS